MSRRQDVNLHQDANLHQDEPAPGRASARARTSEISAARAAADACAGTTAGRWQIAVTRPSACVAAAWPIDR